MAWELIQTFMGEAHIVDFALSYADCLQALAKADYIADGMASFTCEIMV